MTTIASKLPGGDADGLGPITYALVDNPAKVHVVIGFIDCSEVKIKTDTGESVPTIRFRRIEAITGDDIKLAEQVLRRALERRTGQTTLPYDTEQELRAVFENVDPATGELFGDDSE